MDADDVLEPGERPTWEGRPSGWRPSRRAIYVYVLALVGASLAAWYVLALAIASFHARGLGVGPIVVGPMISVSGASATASRVASGRREVPNPLGVLVLLGVYELARTAAWRSRRYLVTDRRVLVVTGKGRLLGRPILREHVRGVEATGPGGRDLRVLGRSSSLVFEGVSEPDGARAALAEPPLPGGGAPPETSGARPPRRSRRRVVGLVVSVLGFVPALALGYAEWLDDPAADAWLHPTTATSLYFFEGRAQVSGRPTLGVVVVSARPIVSTMDGRGVTISGRRFEGVGKVLLVDASGAVSETRAPLFPILWPHREDLPQHVDEVCGTTARDRFGIYLRQLPREGWDEALRVFLGVR